jgi:hypothetical protein
MKIIGFNSYLITFFTYRQNEVEYITDKMAAALTALNNYFNDRLGIGDPQTCVALNNQGLQAINNFRTLLVKEKDITEICTNKRNPGGTDPNPAFDPASPVPGVLHMIPNPGIQFRYVYDKRPNFLRYYLLHIQRIQQPMGVAHATLARLTTCY